MRWQFSQNKATVSISDSSAQQAIDYFKVWLPKASEKLLQTLTQERNQRIAAEEDRLRRLRAAEQQRQNVIRNLTF